MTMIEQMARAIASSLDEDMPRFVRQPWEQMTELAREAMRKRARAALAAMREPTEAMDRAGLVHAINCDPRETWCDMIDAALAE